jgi:hypothetical protein
LSAKRLIHTQFIKQILARVYPYFLKKEGGNNIKIEEKEAEMKKIFLLALLLLGSVILFSCSKSTSPDKGRIAVYLTDAPSSFDAVNIVVTQVSVHMAGNDSLSGWQTISDTTAYYDLLTLQNGAEVLFANHQLPAGQYTQIRLLIGNGSNVVVNGVTYPLTIPSGSQTGIKLNHTFTIVKGEVYQVLLDFDAEESIIQTGTNQYKLNPVIRVVPVLLSGDIKGIVVPHAVSILTTSGSDTVSVTEADVSTGFFKIVGLLAGSYDLEFTPESISYADSTIYNVNVTAGQTTDLDTIALRHLP